MSGNGRRKWLWIAILLVAGAGLAYRLTHTAEFIARYGSDRARVDICRAVPTLNSKRQEPLLLRLLSDPIEDVRLTAITASSKSTETTAINERLENMLKSEQATPIERAKAGELLLSRAEIRGTVLDYLQTQGSREEFRRLCPRLVALSLARESGAGSVAAREQIVELTLKDDEPAAEYARKVALEDPRHFLAWRKRFEVNAESSSAVRRFADSMQRAFDQLSHKPTDDDAENQKPIAGQTFALFDAAWVQDIQPNYQIDEFKNIRCLTLEEGAGGVMSWLKAEDGTVDVGEAKFSMLTTNAGSFELWAHVWFDDKCGNSFGIWVDNTQFDNFSDDTSLFRQWHWLPLLHGGAKEVSLSKGLHKGRLQAWEDGVYIEKLALVPAGTDPEQIQETPRVCWDSSLPSSLSLSVKCQSQPRGTTQPVNVWVRRNSKSLTAGTVRLKVPPPFTIENSETEKRISFADNDPLAKAAFQISLPANSTVGEATMSALYVDDNGEGVSGEMILGGQFDWLTTGPLDPSDELQLRLSDKMQIKNEELGKEWSLYPAKGCDPYRRLDLERAYGQIRDKYIYFCTEIEVGVAGNYLALLTSDDNSHIYIDGKLLIEQPGDGPGEGRLVMAPFEVQAGRHRLFARLRQSDAENPDGPDRYHHTWNHCNMKLLLRKSRHEAAESIKGLHSDLGQR